MSQRTPKTWEAGAFTRIDSLVVKVAYSLDTVGVARPFAGGHSVESMPAMVGTNGGLVMRDPRTIIAVHGQMKLVMSVDNLVEEEKNAGRRHGRELCRRSKRAKRAWGFWGNPHNNSAPTPRSTRVGGLSGTVLWGCPPNPQARFARLDLRLLLVTTSSGKYGNRSSTLPKAQSPSRAESLRIASRHTR